jgi:hypothetical protein
VLVHDVAAAPGLDHRRHEAAQDVDRTHQIHIDAAPPVLLAERRDRAPDGDAGDVHDQIEAAVRVRTSRAAVIATARPMPLAAPVTGHLHSLGERIGMRQPPDKGDPAS